MRKRERELLVINNISPQLYAANYDIGGEKGHGQGRETES